MKTTKEIAALWVEKNKDLPPEVQASNLKVLLTRVVAATRVKTINQIIRPIEGYQKISTAQLERTNSPIHKQH